MKRFLTFLMTVMALFAFATSVKAQGVYTPTVTDDETSVFLETSHGQAYVWAWNGDVNFNTRKVFPGDKMTYMGKTSDGKNIFKWTYTGSEKGIPANVIFSREDNNDSKFVDGDPVYVNHGYYVEGVHNKTISSTPVPPSTKSIYLFTGETINGEQGNYSTDTPIETHKLSLVDGKTTLYKYEVNTSTSDENFWFRFYVKDETKQLQPQANDDPVTVTAAGASTSVYTNIYEGSSNAWKTTFDKSAYDKLTIYLDIATPRRLWIVGSKNSVVTEKEYVLVDNNGAFGFIENNSQFIGANDETSASLAEMMIVFDDEMGGVTEIKHVEVEKNADNAYYTLQGVKVLRPTKGIFIHNGKKIVIK